MSFEQHGFDKLRTDVLAGQLSRRLVLKRAMALGLSAPVIAGLLAACGDDEEEAGSDPTSPSSTGGDSDATTEPDAGDATEATEDSEGDAAETPADVGSGGGQRGGGGQVRLLYWQAPTIINPHLAQGTKDYHASRVCLEPLIEFDDDLNPMFYLATEYPSIENETLAEDGTWAIWKLREGVKWHDGEDFNAEDVKFTFDWIVSEGNSATTLGVYINIESVEIVDDYTVRINFKSPDPVWFDPFRGHNGLILPEHVFRDYMGAEGRNAPANLMPIGTGPYQVVDFRPGDVVVYEIFMDYWEEGKPFFDSVEMKGGGDAAAAARSVLQTGEADWAWNLVVEPQVLNQLLEAGQGELSVTPGVSYERILINFADPLTEVDGAFAEPSTEHPIFSDRRIRKALDLTIPRDVVREQLYGEGDEASAALLPNMGVLESPNITFEYDPEAAQALLDEAGFSGFDIVFQTSNSPVRQRNQEILKAEWEKLGFTVELKVVESSVYFSGDVGNPDTTSHFYADLEMYTTSPSSPLPISYLERWRSDDIAQQSNSWSGSNYSRYSNPRIDEWHDELKGTLDEDRQVELVHQITETVWEDVVEMTVVAVASKAAKSNRIAGHVNYVWQYSPMPQLKDWTLNEE